MKKLFVFLFSLAFVAAFSLPAKADSYLPGQIQEIFDLLGPDGSGAVGFVVSRVQLAFFIAIGLLVLVAVAYAMASAFKYIRSQGDQGQIEEAQKAIKAIFFGIAMMMVAIIGMVLVFVFFGLGTPEPELFQVCVSAPGSVGCQACKTDGASNTCQFCELDYEAQASRRLPDVNSDFTLDYIDVKSVIDINGVVGDGRNCIEPLKGGNQL